MMGKSTRLKDFMFGIIIGLTLMLFILATFVLEDISLSSIKIVSYSLSDYSYGAIRSYHSKNKNSSSEPEFLPENDSCEGQIARDLSRKVRVLIWVLTSPKTLRTKAQAIKDTWAKRCNVILYFSSVSDPTFPAVGLGVPEGRDHLTGKTMAAFRYIYEKHLDDADWFMKADDDTYVIVENLRYFLSNKDTHSPVYYGHLFKKNVKQGYYSGGGGYVISKEALRRFGTQAVNSTLCEKDGADEDVDFGFCMEKLGVQTFRTVDEKGRSLFHPYQPEIHFHGKYSHWHYRYTAGFPQKGFGVSRYAVTFHYTSPEDMLTLDFFFYHIRAYGIHSTSGQCNQTVAMTT